MKRIISTLLMFLLLIGCSKERPVKSCDTFTELPDPNVDTASWNKPIKEGLIASFVDIDKKYPKSSIPDLSELSRKQKIEGWKGERVSSQILLWTTNDISQVEVEISDFKSKDKTLSKDIAQARFVRYVMTDEFANGCGRRVPENFAASLTADMLDTLDCFNIEAKTVRPVWITLDLPHDAEAGIYSGSIQLFAKGEETQNFLLEVEVINQILPPPSEWKIHLDLWQHPSAVARVYNLEVWSDAHFEKMEPVMKMLANMGQKVITTNINKDPWNNQCFDAYQDMIKWTKLKNGKWIFDYTIFDKWVQFMMDLGINKMINCYSMVPWKNELHYINAATSEIVNIKADPGSKAFEEIWAPFLSDFVKHLKEKGWLEITNIAMDERSPKEMDAVMAVLKKHAPELGISLADNHKSYKKYPHIKDMCAGAEAPVDPNDIKIRRDKGLITTYYVCCAHEFPNTFTFSDPAEGTYTFWYAAAADFDGFLRWSYNSWNENPLIDSRFRTWPAGDTYLIYPDARSSIRYERMLEGVQDFEKIHIIRKILEEKSSTELLNKFNSTINKFNTVERTTTWNTDLSNAKRQLNEIARQF